ncbi:MAG: hypothetical protein V4864_04430 [Pseudomonadota bacterium]
MQQHEADAAAGTESAIVRETREVLRDEIELRVALVAASRQSEDQLLQIKSLQAQVDAQEQQLVEAQANAKAIIARREQWRDADRRQYDQQLLTEAIAHARAAEKAAATEQRLLRQVALARSKASTAVAIAKVGADALAKARRREQALNRQLQRLKDQLAAAQERLRAARAAKPPAARKA